MTKFVFFLLIAGVIIFLVLPVIFNFLKNLLQGLLNGIGNLIAILIILFVALLALLLCFKFPIVGIPLLVLVVIGVFSNRTNYRNNTKEETDIN